MKPPGRANALIAGSFTVEEFELLVGAGFA